MVIVMEHTASEENVQKVIESLVEVGYDVHRSSGVDFTVLGAVGVPHGPMDPRLIEVLPGVREVVRVSEPYKLAGRTFKRRFAAATGLTPIAYVQRLRVEGAKRRLERTEAPVDEIGWRVGYEDAAFFRRLFKRTTGLGPGAYRKRFAIPGFARS